MNYTYEIVKLLPKQEFMSVVYRADNHPDFYRNFNPRQYDEAHLVSLIEAFAPLVVETWERWASHPESIDVNMSGSSSAEAPPEHIAPEVLPQPEYDFYTHRPEQNSFEPGDATVGWTLIELTDEEKAVRLEQGALDERAKRNSRLARTDHWVMSDTPEPTQAQLDYRQALRDVPQQAGFPQNIVWPTEPE